MYIEVGSNRSRRGCGPGVLLTLAAAAFFATGPAAHAQGDDAKAILKAMADYVSSQKTIEFKFDSDIEVVTPQLEKIQFTNSGEALLSRPDKLRAHRVGGYADVELYLRRQGRQRLWRNVNGYAQFEVPGTRRPPDPSAQGRAWCRTAWRGLPAVEPVRSPRGRRHGGEAHRPGRRRWSRVRAPRVPQLRYRLAALGGRRRQTHSAQVGNHQQDH